ncbi:ADP-ribosylglycohydrolase family protein [Paenibacillus sp. IB182496]|uniref:ADP-ribosylglycohydrolase family protein n=1 Tax=Paenibacillus sabuli TaxID=2772509 RepID=A0A927GT93_9BACL|nr:ADP-ribosylglycohydrolase family protein [Paenibacillus sabuli]MBD2847574.1 ADP-ribosylglycohydrolase family protein [Paenibacillus sabuli]
MMTTTRILNEQDYYRTVYGGWLGKNIGGTLGAPVEGRMERLDLTFYPVLQDGPLENDDLDLQLVWLHALEQYGPRLTSRELGQEWTEHVFFPFDEYGYALTNLRRGLRAPLTGSWDNPFADCMGSPIRSEIWAMAAPGAPQVAAYYAYQDAVVDHAGGEGVYGEMLFAAIESACFVEKDRDRLIAIGMAYIPDDCRTAKAVNDLLRWHREGKDWLEARDLILAHHGRDNFTDAPQNIAFTLLGWLYGTDFEDAILKAVNCGYDTDCTAATLGAILGMLAGPDALPERWVAPVGDRIVVSAPIKGFPAPANLDELTRRTIRVGRQVLAAWDTGILVHPELPTSATELGAAPGEAVKRLWAADVRTDRRLLPEGTIAPLGLELTIDYGADGPAIARRATKTLTLTVTNHSAERWIGRLGLELPDGWTGGEPRPFELEPGAGASLAYTVRAGEAVASAYELTAAIVRSHDGQVWSELRERFALVPAAEWTIWGPEGGAGRAAAFGGSALAWEQALGTTADGRYRARTRLHCPSARTVRLIAACDAPVTVTLDGARIIACAASGPFMPAYHRAPDAQAAELELTAGSHELEVSAERAGAPLRVRVLAVAPRQTLQPGPYYSYTDILWHD